MEYMQEKYAIKTQVNYLRSLRYLEAQGIILEDKESFRSWAIGKRNKGNGAEQKGNTIENKGNTTENIAIFLIPQSNISLFLIHKGNTKKATLAWRCCR